jgi:hypothetical protein
MVRCWNWSTAFASWMYTLDFPSKNPSRRGGGPSRPRSWSARCIRRASSPPSSFPALVRVSYLRANNAVARRSVKRPFVAFARINGPRDCGTSARAERTDTQRRTTSNSTPTTTGSTASRSTRRATACRTTTYSANWKTSAALSSSTRARISARCGGGDPARPVVPRRPLALRRLSAEPRPDGRGHRHARFVRRLLS